MRVPWKEKRPTRLPDPKVCAARGKRKSKHGSGGKKSLERKDEKKGGTLKEGFHGRADNENGCT